MWYCRQRPKFYLLRLLGNSSSHFLHKSSQFSYRTHKTRRQFFVDAHFRATKSDSNVGFFISFLSSWLFISFQSKYFSPLSHLHPSPPCVEFVCTLPASNTRHINPPRNVFGSRVTKKFCCCVRRVLRSGQLDSKRPISFDDVERTCPLIIGSEIYSTVISCPGNKMSKH